VNCEEKAKMEWSSKKADRMFPKKKGQELGEGKWEENEKEISRR
jgi:hypothetical protein